MNRIYAIPLYQPSDHEAARYFSQNHDEIDSLSGDVVIVIWANSVRDGDPSDVSKAVNSKRYPGLKASDFPCIWVEQGGAAFCLHLPDDMRAINRLLRALIDAAREAADMRALEKTMKEHPDAGHGTKTTRQQPAPQNPPSIPPWFPVAGYITGAATLAFFMWLAVEDRNIATTVGRFAVSASLALGCALAFAFIGGSAAAHGSIPMPFAKQRPVQFTVTGGISVFVIVFLISYNMLRPPAAPAAAPAAATESKTAAAPQPTTPAIVIQVVSASYGLNCKTTLRDNSTAQLAAQCNGRQTCTYAAVGAAGDHAPGCPKEFEYHWTCGDQAPPRHDVIPAEATASGRPPAFLSCARSG